MNITLISILAGIGGMFGWGIYDFLGGVFAKQIGSFRSLFWSQLAGAIALLTLALGLKTGLDFPILIVILLPIASILYSAGYLFFFKGFEKGNVSIVAATMNLWAVFTMLFAFLFMGQRLSGLQTLGVVMILSGATLAALNWNEIKEHKFQLSLGVKETIFGALFFGLFWNVSEIVSQEIGWLPATLFVKFGILLFLLAFSLLAGQKIGLAQISTKTRTILILMGIIETGAVALVNYGLTIGDAILITPIASALSIVTIALAIVFLKDRVTKIQATGMGIAVIGIIITAF
jgi:bacterial/archaeal transporter family protein